MPSPSFFLQSCTTQDEAQKRYVHSPTISLLSSAVGYSNLIPFGGSILTLAAWRAAAAME